MASYVERTENTEESIKKLKAIKERFIKTLRSKLGWKVSVDLDPDYNDLMFDAIFMLSRPATAEESHGEYLKIKYAFMKLGYNDKASFEKYEDVNEGQSTKCELEQYINEQKINEEMNYKIFLARNYRVY